MNAKCLVRGHDWETIQRYNLIPKKDGALKLTLNNFERTDWVGAPYTGLIKLCKRCGTLTTEII
jgi:hypothetical protein